MEDKIPRWLQHCHKTCCKKDGYHGRQACMIWRWFHCRDIISEQVDLHMTLLLITFSISFPSILRRKIGQKVFRELYTSFFGLWIIIDVDLLKCKSQYLRLIYVLVSDIQNLNTSFFI